MLRRTRSAAAATATAVLATLGVGGCGEEKSYENSPRPPSPIVVTASIDATSVNVSPSSFGAGPINLIVVNQTRSSQQVTLETEGFDKAGFKQETGPINPADTATLKASVDPGSYRLRVAGDGIKAATLKVGRKRRSAQNDLLEP